MSDAMGKVVGKVYKVKFFPRSGRFPDKWSVKIDGNPVYFGTDRDPTGIALEGAAVEIEHDEVIDGKYPQAKIISLKAAGPQAAAAVAAAPAYNGSGVRDESIQYQSARKDALEMVKLLVSVSAVKLPAKEANKLEALETLVDTYTAQFYTDIAAKGALARSNGEDEPAKEAAPDPDAE